MFDYEIKSRSDGAPYPGMMAWYVIIKMNLLTHETLLGTGFVLCAVQCNSQMRSGKWITSGRPSPKQKAGANVAAHQDSNQQPLTSYV